MNTLQTRNLEEYILLQKNNNPRLGNGGLFFNSNALKKKYQDILDCKAIAICSGRTFSRFQSCWLHLKAPKKAYAWEEEHRRTNPCPDPGTKEKITTLVI